MVVNEEVKQAYFSALYNQQNGNNEPMKRFKFEYGEIYATINAMYHKRVAVKRDIEVMRELSGNKVYFGALTFNEEKDKNKNTSKRREVFNFLNKIFLMFLVVEELGEENGRYHCHYVGVFRENKTFEDLYKWHSREDCQRVKSTRRVAKYLCNYIVKQVPRIRRNKVLIKVSNDFKKSRSWSNYGFMSFARDLKAQAFNTIFLEDLEVDAF